MIFPSFLLASEVQSDSFELWLRLLVSKSFPMLLLESISVGSARHYTLKKLDKSVVEIAVLPQHNGLEVRVARLYGAALGHLYGGEVVPSSSWVTFSQGYVPAVAHADNLFCQVFYEQVVKEFVVDFGPNVESADEVLRDVRSSCILHTYAEMNLAYERYGPPQLRTEQQENADDAPSDEFSDDVANQEISQEAPNLQMEDNAELSDPLALLPDVSTDEPTYVLPTIDPNPGYVPDFGPPSQYDPPMWGFDEIRQTFSLGVSALSSVTSPVSVVGYSQSQPIKATHTQPPKNESREASVSSLSSSSKAYPKRRKMQFSTETKLELLRKLRKEHIRGKQVSITFTTACEQVPIAEKTVRTHDWELCSHWDDPTY